MIRSDPPGATVYTQDAQGAWRIWGATPFALTIDVPNPWSECVQTGVVRIQWPSGASARVDTLSVCPKDAVHEYTFKRPDGPGRDLDDPTARARAFPIFVGPQVRDGFVDVDKGVLDSIQDILGELRGSRRFAIVRSPDVAVLQLFVVGRRIAGQGDSYGVPIGGVFYTASVKRRAIATILRVGTYEKATTSEDPSSDTWTGAAQRVVKGVCRPRRDEVQLLGRRPNQASLMGISRPVSWREPLVPAAMTGSNKWPSSQET